MLKSKRKKELEEAAAVAPETAAENTAEASEEAAAENASDAAAEAKAKEKKKEEKKARDRSLLRMIAYSKRYLPAVILVILFTTGGALISLISPSRVSDLMNTVMAGVQALDGVDMAALRKVVVSLAILYLTSVLLSYGEQFVTTTVTQRATQRLRRELSEKLHRLPLRYYDTAVKGDVLSTMINDVSVVSQMLTSCAPGILSGLVMFVGVLFLMFKTSAILALITIGISVLGLVGMLLLLKVSQKYYKRRQEDLGKMNGHIEEIYSNYNIVYAFGARKREQKRFEEYNDRLFEANWKSQVLGTIMSQIMTFSNSLSFVAIFAVGVAMILNGNRHMDLGTIMAYLIYARLFTQPVTTLAGSVASLQQAAASSKRVFDLLDYPELEDESDKTRQLPDAEGNVSFENVHFGYKEDHEIIHGLSVDLKRGQKVAIVGPTGAGKTTLVNLLMRFYETDSGDIRVDGVSIRDMKRETVHDLFDMILQDTWLFEGTIRENLIYNTENVTEERLNEVCRAVGLEHFIEQLPEGYDTGLSDNLHISEGQKQQLTIARAMLRDAPLLILDEATSSVDSRTEIIIQQAMDKLTEGRTSFVIAHRLSTIKNADIILVMQGGDVVEQGSHAELLEKGGVYAEMYNSQFEETA